MIDYIKYGLIALGGIATLVLALMSLTSKKNNERLTNLALMLSVVYAVTCTMFQGALSALDDTFGVSSAGWGNYFRINTTGFIVIGVLGALFVVYLVLALLIYKKNLKACDADRSGKGITRTVIFILSIVGVFYTNSVWHYSSSDRFPLWLALDRMGPIKYKNAYYTLFNYEGMLPKGDAILFAVFGLAYICLFALLIMYISRGSYTAITVSNIILLFTVAVDAILLITPSSYGVDCWMTPTPWVVLAVAIANRLVIAKHFGEKFKVGMFLQNQLA